MSELGIVEYSEGIIFERIYYNALKIHLNVIKKNYNTIKLHYYNYKH